MENLKHTKKYAIQLATIHQKEHGGFTSDYVSGYMKAIEETGVADLLDVCQKLLIDFIYALSNQGKVLGWSDEKIQEQIEKHTLIISTRNAINKATK